MHTRVWSLVVFVAVIGLAGCAKTGTLPAPVPAPAPTAAAVVADGGDVNAAK